MGSELHLKFYFASNMSLWQDPFKPMTLDGHPLNCFVLYFFFAV